MKKILIISILSSILAGCASYLPAGGMYTSVKMGQAAPMSGVISKTGTACSHSYLWIVAFGNASIESAKADGNIINVISINYFVDNYAGIYAHYCIEVNGN